MKDRQYTTKELFRRFQPYFKPYWKTLVLDLFCAGLTTLCELVLPMIMRYITNQGLYHLAELSVQTILGVVAIYLALRIVDCVATYYMAGVGHIMGAKIETDMRRDAYQHLHQLRIIALETIVLTENFTAISNPRKYACYIGIAPFKKESGTSVRKKTGVSKKGFSEAKADLSIAVLSAITYNPAIRDYWIRKKKEKCGGIVLNAIKFKLVLRMFAVIKRGTPYVETDAYKN